MTDERSRPGRLLFRGPISILVSGRGEEYFPNFPEMRFDGKRWVDVSRPDRPFVPVHIPPPPREPDMFGGTGDESQRLRYPKNTPGKVTRSRRRGPA